MARQTRILCSAVIIITALLCYPFVRRDERIFYSYFQVLDKIPAVEGNSPPKGAGFLVKENSIFSPEGKIDSMVVGFYDDGTTYEYWTIKNSRQGGKIQLGYNTEVYIKNVRALYFAYYGVQHLGFKGEVNAKVMNFEMDNMSFDSARLEIRGLYVHIKSCTMKRGVKIGGFIHHASLSDVEIKGLDFAAVCDTLLLDNIRIDSPSTINARRYVSINGLTGSQRLKLKTKDELRYSANVKLCNVDLDQIEFEDGVIHFVVDTCQEHQSFQRQLKLYNQLIKHFEQNEVEREQYEIERKRIIANYRGERLEAFINEFWNDFGFDKYYLFENATFWLALFWGVNILLYPDILYKGYPINEFIKADRAAALRFSDSRRRGLMQALHCLYYTLFIFWSLRLSLENIKIGRILYTTWIILQFVVGLVFLAYIANIIITK